MWNPYMERRSCLWEALKEELRPRAQLGGGPTVEQAWRTRRNRKESSLVGGAAKGQLGEALGTWSAKALEVIVRVWALQWEGGG